MITAEPLIRLLIACSVNTGLKRQCDANCEGWIEETSIEKKYKSEGMLLPTQAVRLTLFSCVATEDSGDCLNQP